MLKSKDRANPCRITFKNSEFDHSFGGLPKHIGATPRSQSISMHLLLMLDLNDPLVPLEFVDKTIRTLPLYYPLRYGGGGGEAQYRVVSNSRIELIYINESGPDDEEYPFMESFPDRPCALELIPYENFRAHLMWEHGNGYIPSVEDKRLCHELMPFMLLAPDLLPFCGPLRWRCRNKDCDWFDREQQVSTFARISAVPTDDIEIFGEHGTEVEIYYSTCRKCGTIVTENRCT